MILKSVHLAEEARNRFLILNPHAPKPLIAASIGPYGAYLANGSEYRGDYDIFDQELRDFDEPRINLLAIQQRIFWLVKLFLVFGKQKCYQKFWSL